ncbi:hypothetical protein ACN27F_32480 [Solwaraspora sp. WMMB335]|uniref:hypothetical protein n=1 Tax=Solwaraspora sp. WMMB335 TaxID=3404118 RepID=UPI003B947FD6
MRSTSVLASAIAVLSMLPTGILPGPARGHLGPAVLAAARQGSLSITAPATASLGATGVGGSLSAQMGTVTVTGPVISIAWTATVAASAFVTGAGTLAETIPNGGIAYWSGPVTSSSGIGLIATPGQPTAADAQPLDTARTAFQLLAGANSVIQWNPTLVVTVPAAAVAGTYTGTIVHSVA